MKSYTIEQIEVNRFTIRDDSKPETNYTTCSIPGILSELAKVVRAGARVAFKVGDKERVILHQQPGPTDYNSRPEGLTPLIFFAWLKDGNTTRREIIRAQTNNVNRCWQANEYDRYTGALIKGWSHEYAGGLAAQLESEVVL